MTHPDRSSTSNPAGSPKVIDSAPEPSYQRTVNPASPHPESYCHRCGGPNVVWTAPSPLWNAVMRGGSIMGTEEFGGIVCPTCFAVLAEARGVADGWVVEAKVVHASLELVTPSGRTWDAGSRRWMDPGASDEDER